MEDLSRRKKEQKKLPIFLIFGLILFFIFLLFPTKSGWGGLEIAQAATAPAIITYQGKLLINSRLATTTQNMYFILYDAASAGNILYTASGTIATPQAVSTTPSQGLFSINLGDTGTNALSQAIFQNNGSVYLEVRVGADTLTPRKQITAAPYALNSRYLDGVGVKTVSTTPYIPMSDANGNFTFNSTTITTSTISNLNVLSKIGFNSTSPIASLAVQGIGGANPFEIASSTGSSLFRILTNGNVGINSSSPIDTLAIQGGFQVVGGVTSTNLNITGVTNLATTTITNVTSTNLNVSTLANIKQLGINTSSPIATFAVQGTGGINPFSINSSSGTALLNILTNGNIGIGTNTPSALLDIRNSNSTTRSLNIVASSTNNLSQITSLNLFVSGDTNLAKGATGLFIDRSISGNANGIIFMSTSTALWSTTLDMTTNDLVFSYDMANEKDTFRQSQGGKFFIGNDVSSPLNAGAQVTVFTSSSNALRAFDVYGSMRVLSTPGFASVFDVNTTSSLVTVTSEADDATALSIGNPSATQIDGLYLSKSGDVARNWVTWHQGSGVADWRMGMQQYDFGIFNAGGGTANASNPGRAYLTILQSNGNIGFGTTTPIAVLSVLASSTNGNNPIMDVASSTGASLFRILANGNVGINSSTPIDTLAVQGGFQVVGGVTSTNLYVSGLTNIGNTTITNVTTTNLNVSTLANIKQLGINSSSPIATLALQGVGGTNPFEVASSTGASLFRILQNGNVGIGTSNIGTALEVNGSIRLGNGAAGGNTFQVTLNRGASTDGADLFFTTGGTSDWILGERGTSDSNFHLYSYGINGDALTVSRTTGSLGINSSTPIATLALQGVGGTNPFSINSSTGASLLTILQNGNVGINSSTPSTKLAVNGTSYFSQTSTFGGNISNIVDSNTVISSIATTSVEKGNTSIFVSGRYAYVTNYTSNTLSVVDVSNPSFPRQIATTSVGTNPISVYVSGHYAYVVNFNANSISVVDVSNPAVPYQVATTSVGTSLTPSSIYVSGHYAYVANNGSHIISVIDVSNPLAPVKLNTVTVEDNSSPRAVAVSGHYAYVANYASNTISVFDISDPAVPVQIASTSVGTGPSYIYVSGRYAYISNTGDNSISIVDISNPSAPIQTANLVAVGGGTVNSIFVSGRYAYVAARSQGNVFIFDVSSSSVPKQVATVTAGIADPQSIYVSGRYAYVSGSGNMSVIDISGTEVTSIFAHSAEVGNLQVRNDIFAQGNIMAGTSLMVGAGGIMSNGSLSIFASSSTGVTTTLLNISSAQSPNLLKVFANGNVSIGTSTSAQRLSVSGNISNIIDSGTTISQVSTVAVGNSPISVFVSGRYAYVASQNPGTFSVIDVSSPSVPALIVTTSVSAVPYSVFVSGRYAYLANSNSDSITVMDVSNPVAPKEIATTTVGSAPVSVYVSGRYAYVADAGSPDSISIVDISNPLAPRQIATTSVDHNPQSIFVSGRYAYTANYSDNDISIIDVSNPSAPIQVATTSVQTNPNSIYVSGRYAYVANYGSASISIVDISNPAAPIQTSTVAVGGSPDSIFVSGRYAYVTSRDSDNISIVDISNPAAPVKVISSAAGTFAINPIAIYVSGRYAYVANNGASTMSVFDISGTEVSSLMAHSAEVGNLQSRNDIFAQGNIMAGTSLLVGGGGIMSQGALSVYASSTGATSSIFDISSAQTQNIFKIFANGNIGIGTSTPTARLTIQGSGTANPFSILTSTAAASSMFSVLTNGNVGINTSSPIATFALQGTGGTNPFSINSSTGASLLTILTNGNVGINSSTPSASLAVAGTSYFTQTSTFGGNISNLIDGNTTLSQIATTSVGKTPTSIFVSGRYAYVANNASNTISIVDVSDPTAPVQISTTSVGVTPQTIYVSGRYAYTANNGDNTVSVIDISNPKFPIQVATAATYAKPYGLYVSGRYAYITYSNGASMGVIDISNPLAPVQVVTTSVGNIPAGIYVSGRYAYVVNEAPNTISVVDVSNPSNPVQIASTSVGALPMSVYVSGRYAYVANFSDSNISVVDISNPAAPSAIGTSTVGTNPNSIYVSGRYAYVANQSSANISIVDISSSTNPTQITTVAVGASPRSVYVSGRYAYVANGNLKSISVVDISGTEVTSLMAHSAEVGNLQSRNDIFASGNIMAGTGLMVGAGGIMSNGSLSVYASSTGVTSSIFDISSAASSSIFKVFSNGKIGIGTSIVTSTLDVQGTLEVNLVSTTAATAGLCHVNNGPTDNQVVVDCTGAPGADYMEMYPADAGLQKGDLVMLSTIYVTTTDGNRVPKLTKSTAAYQSGLMGVISDPDQAGDFNSIGYNIPSTENPLPLALNGRVLLKVSNINGDIHAGDKLTSSNIPGVAMKATEEGPTIAIAMGDYTSLEVGMVMSFVNNSWNNKLYKALTIDTDAKTLTVGTSTNPYDLIVTGNISLNNNIINKLSFATSTLFESNVGSFAGAKAFILNAINFSSTSADNYLISLRSNNTPVFSVAANGDVHAKGNYYGASAVLGTSTNPGDLAERVDVAIDDVVEPGDVMMVDQNAPDTYRRSGSAYEQSVAGIISSNPTIVVGNGKTDYTAVMAMVGRVPVKVTNENGAIARGDLLITASAPGLAMKYDPAKDKKNKMVAVIGVALEPLNTSTGKILALIRTGWVYNRDQAINNLQDNIQQMAAAQGIDLSTSSAPGNLNVANSNGQLTYTGGNLDLQNNSIINVATIVGKNNKWRIDVNGNLIQKIATAIGDKETYGLQSSGKQEIVISGTSTLENGIRKIILTDLDQAVIDKTIPLKIQITPAGETKGVYVSERNYDSFTVKENENGQSNASFDWTVIAKILSPADAPDTMQSNHASGGQSAQPTPGATVDVSTTTNSETPPNTGADFSITTTSANSEVPSSASPTDAPIMP